MKINNKIYLYNFLENIKLNLNDAKRKPDVWKYIVLGIFLGIIVGLLVIIFQQEWLIALLGNKIYCGFGIRPGLFCIPLYQGITMGVSVVISVMVGIFVGYIIKLKREK